MTCTREPAGNTLWSGGSRRHVGGASGAAVKPWKSGRHGKEPLHTMYVGRDVESPEIRSVPCAQFAGPSSHGREASCTTRHADSGQLPRIGKRSLAAGRWPVVTPKRFLGGGRSGASAPPARPTGCLKNNSVHTTSTTPAQPSRKAADSG
jgi:hypothetical protein